METRSMVIIVKDSFEPSNDNTNIVNAPREPFVVNQDPGENSSQSPPQINHHCCYGCGDPLEDIFCHQCTCELCGNGAHYGYNYPPKVPIVPNPKPFNNQTIKELPPTVQSFDPKSNLVHDSPNVFNPPSQIPFYSCEFCGNDAHYDYYCTPQVTHGAYQCQPMNEDYYHEQNSCYDPNSFGFDQFQPQQYTINHPIFNSQNDLFDSQNKLIEQLTSVCDMVGQFIQKNKQEKQTEEEQAANTRYWKILACYDDDDDDHNEPDNSLSMGDEHLDTILAMESDEFIKSSVENLIQTQLSLRVTMSILLYDNSPPRPPEEFISENSDAIESFFPSPIPVEDSDSLMEEIDLSFTSDYPMPSGIEEDDYDSERDILIID
nr:hypothetical protein [Tanacetum cinerariifolium]